MNLKFRHRNSPKWEQREWAAIQELLTMVRPKAKAPAISLHMSGQAIAKFDGVTFYLGPHNSAQAFAKYAYILRQYQANDYRLPDHITPHSVRQLAETFGMEPEAETEIVDQSKTPVLIEHLTALYRSHIENIYKSSPIELYRLKRLCDELELHSGKMLAGEYGPRALQEQRQKWVNSGKSRKYCNRLTNATVRIFKFGVSQELVDPSRWQALKSLEPLKEGQTEAPETEPVQPVPLDHVRKTIKHLSPVLVAIIRVQVATGARPSEILNMRPCDIDRTGPEWIYRPAKHKNAKRGKLRVIPLLGDAKEVVIDYINRDPDSFLFSPRESVAWHNAQKRAARKSKVQPSQRDRSKPNAAIKPREAFDVHSYRRAIERACKAAGVPTWHPYQLRHSAGTIVREALGPEAAQALLGHSNLRMTEHYAKVSERKAIEAAKHAPKL